VVIRISLLHGGANVLSSNQRFWKLFDRAARGKTGKSLDLI